MGNKAPDQDPNHFESTVANLTDKLHITRDLAHRLTRRQQEKSQQYQNQTKQMGKDTAAGVLPYAMTPEGQAEAAKLRTLSLCPMREQETRQPMRTFVDPMARR